MQIRLVRN